MQAFLSIARSSLVLLPIALATAAHANDPTENSQVDLSGGQQGTLNTHDFGDIQQLFSGRNNPGRGAPPGVDAVKAFRPYNAPLSDQQNQSDIPVAPKRVKSTGDAGSFRPYSEPVNTADDSPAPGTTLNSDGHKDKLFNPQLSAHSNTQYRSTTGYVLGKTGQYALRYGPRILRYIHY
jgi:hypothetical protein